MSKFITGKELEEAVDRVIWEADEQLMIVSPYIKLDEHFRKLFTEHLLKPKLHITLMFGKNEGRVDKSFNKADFDFFLQFPNISIVYVPNLHAKYYANELMGVVTSINLYDYSFVNNIEFGVLYEYKLLSLTNSSDDDVWDKCQDIANENEVIFVKRPIFQKGFLGMSKSYMSSKILLDRTEELYSGKQLAKGKQKLEDFEEELNATTDHSERPIRQEIETKKGTVYYAAKQPTPEKPFEPGYCIRTGEKIPFNVKSPFSKQAYQSWSKYKNDKFAEKFCHFSGEPSNGEISFKKPILAKNWKMANPA
ncbi:hypothetical protein DXT99_04905 [Pontibacter diazotrophicus]|uniref:Phospholipase D-like domain-containing protein n=1 Tax=Pontibacter diazotrophicus TaxID=1400979 RepID=A0A3D8LH26_9BACT|nr:hypothetical protein [Pontibacter diazotrophicus]RDV16534.1 hypothetical protein DXT99_04905 [Pontibacter diazotrophicus]